MFKLVSFKDAYMKMEKKINFSVKCFSTYQCVQLTIYCSLSGIVSPCLLMFTGKWKLTYRIAGRCWGGMSEAWSSGLSQGNVTLDPILCLYLLFHISMYCFLNLLWFFYRKCHNFFSIFFWWFCFKMLLGYL